MPSGISSIKLKRREWKYWGEKTLTEKMKRFQDERHKKEHTET